MRLAYFADTPRLGGAERFLVDVASGVSEAGHEIIVLSPQDEMLELVRSELPAARVVRAGTRALHGSRPRAKKLASLVASLPSVRAALADTSADLLHVNNGGYPGSELCRVAPLMGRAAGIPAQLLTVHAAPAIRRPVDHVADSVVWRSVEAVHFATEFVGHDLVALRGMPPQLGRRVPYGVREPLGETEGEALRERLAGRALLAGMISATSDREKGHHVFVEALARSDPAIRGFVTGPVPAELPAQIRELGLVDRVTLTGRIHDQEEFGSYMHACDVLVVPSTAYESLPLVVLEGMAAGRPVFASRLSGIPEAVVDGETGRLFTPGSVDELAARLREAALDRSQLDRFGSRARDRFAASFSLDTMIRNMLALYDELSPRSSREVQRPISDT
jgi:glycosyltransferase involved in cell wall biosynthesis